MSEHTKGRLVADGPYLQTVGGEDLKIVSAWREGTIDHATEAWTNARRLVACWNACEGISTEILAVEPVSLNDLINGLRADRAELVAAIEDAPHAGYCGAPSSSGSQVYECRCWKSGILAKHGPKVIA